MVICYDLVASGATQLPKPGRFTTRFLKEPLTSLNPIRLKIPHELHLLLLI